MSGAVGAVGAQQRERAQLRAHQTGTMPLHRVHDDVHAQPGGSRPAEGRTTATADVHAAHPVRMFQSVAVLFVLGVRAHVHRESADTHRAVSTPVSGRSLPLSTRSSGFIFHSFLSLSVFQVVLFSFFFIIYLI